MMRFTSSLFLALLCALFATRAQQIGAARPGQKSTPTAMQLTLATMLAGQYSNYQQYLDDIANNVTGLDKHAWLQLSYVPALVPVLSPAVTFYYEQYLNNGTSPRRQQIFAFTQETPCVIRGATYDIANASRFSTEPEALLALQNLELSELSNRPECDSLWTLLEDEFFFSQLATDQCTFTVFGAEVRPEGTRNLTCPRMTFSEVWRKVSDGSVIAGTEIPYILEKTGNHYPVPVNLFSAVKCFTVPCKNNGNSAGDYQGPTWNEIKLQMTYSDIYDDTSLH